MELSHCLGQIIQTLMEPVAIEDDSGRIVFANRALEELLGYGSGELVGLPWTVLFPGEQRHQAEFRQGQHLSSATSGYETRLQLKDGSTAPVLASSHLLYNGDQRLGILSAFADPDVRGRLQTQLPQSDRVAPDVEQLAGVAHELRNSLTIIFLQSRLLAKKEPQSPQAAECLRILRHQVKRMMQMVDTLRTSSDPHQPQMETIDVNGLIRRILELQQHELERDGIGVTTNLAADLPATQADAYQLQQIFVNLINNARQAITAVRAKGRLAVATELAGGGNGRRRTIRIRFADDGPGISPNVLPHIFEPFYTTKKPGQGVGLGLAISEQIVRKHGGRIWVENNSSGGATFVLELPVTDPAHSEGAPTKRAVPPAAGTTRSDAAPSDCHILVLDDNPVVLRAVAQVLRREGYRVTTAAEPSQVFAVLDEGQIDLVISDLNMPHMSGRQFYQTATEGHPRLAGRIVFATGDSSGQPPRTFYQDCICIEKPFKADELLQLIDEALTEG